MEKVLTVDDFLMRAGYNPIRALTLLRKEADNADPLMLGEIRAELLTLAASYISVRLADNRRRSLPS